MRSLLLRPGTTIWWTYWIVVFRWSVATIWCTTAVAEELEFIFTTTRHFSPDMCYHPRRGISQQSQRFTAPVTSILPHCPVRTAASRAGKSGEEEDDQRTLLVLNLNTQKPDDKHTSMTAVLLSGNNHAQCGAISTYYHIALQPSLLLWWCLGENSCCYCCHDEEVSFPTQTETASVTWLLEPELQQLGDIIINTVNLSNRPWQIGCSKTLASRIVDCHPLAFVQSTIKNVNTVKSLTYTLYANADTHPSRKRKRRRHFLAQEGSSELEEDHDYEVVYPVLPLVTTGNTCLPSSLNCTATSDDKSSRARRSLHLTNETDYIIQAFGKSFHFDWTHLVSPRSILTPNFIVQRVGPDSTWLDEDGAKRDSGWLDSCLRTGTVNGDDDSKAVMDLCWNTLHNLKKPASLGHPATESDRRGLMGAFHVWDDDYLLQPAGDLLTSPTSSSNLPPHIVYRTRRHLPEVNATKLVHNLTAEVPPVNRTRTRREIDGEFAATAWEYHVELLIVADYSMRQFHGKDLDEYILTLMSIVGMIYRDASIGNSLSVTVAKLIVLESESEGPRVTWSAQETLESFCKWQAGYNMQEDTHPYHHDAAILITRQDLCRVKNKCDTLGLAEIGTMCDAQKSCAIVEDSGLSSAFTIAHELGHLFNIPHDDDRVCRTFMPSTYSSYTSVMAPRLDHNSNPWTWSPCSAKKLMDYLESGEGSCLLDEPSTNSNNIPTRRAYLTQGKNDFQLERMSVNSFLFPGEMFDVDKQCQLVFGEGASVCPFMPVCKRLWCTTSLGNQTGCRTQHLPWADGTFCGFNMWCKRGDCVKKDFTRLDPVNGGWGSFSRWGRCSRTCGGGIKESFRECDNPKPLNGGKYCIGQRVRYKSCNIKECAPAELDFREEQCSAFNGKTMGYQGVEPSVIWSAKLYGQTSRQKCKLYCRVDGTTKFFLLKEKVIDGTSCGPDPADICVNGICKKAGCDGKLGSQMRRDTCGVCGGDNSTCRTISGTYNERNYGYNFVVAFPNGASNIDIRQHAYEGMKDDYNYLALVNSHGTYLFNGDFVVSIFHKEIPVKNAMIDYTGSDTVVERLNCTDSIGENLSLYVLTVGELYPPDIYYTYMVSVGDEYRWDPEGPWNSCSKECKGLQYRNLLCVRKMDRHPVAKGNCMGHAPPSEHSRPCNEHCSLRWDVMEDPDSQCNAPCSEQGTIRRRVRCLRETVNEHKTHGEAHLWYQDSLSSADQRNMAPRIQEVDLDKCDELSDAKPTEELPCVGSCRLVAWKYTAWSECSRPCGGGIQSRSSICVDLSTGHYVQPYNCSFHQTPEPNQKSCNPQPCAADWTVGPWSSCSATCGHGIMRRAVKCLLRVEGSEAEDMLCDPVKKPAIVVKCPHIPCPPPPISRPPPAPKPPIYVSAQPSTSDAVEWVTGSWTACSKTCGVGEKYRSVGCRGSGSGRYLAHLACAGVNKPHERDRCYMPECGVWQFGEWGTCTATCDDGLGGAMQRRYVACVVDQKPIKDEEECDKDSKPPTAQRCENLPQCEMRTMIRMTDSGRRGVDDPLQQVKYEHVYLPATQPAWTAASTTIATTRPPTSAPTQFRKGVWITGGWGKCSKACNGGMKLRLVACQFPENYARDSDGPVCDESKRPTNISRCNDQTCPEWQFGQWGTCTKSCGGGNQRRTVQCIDSRGAHMSSYQCSRAQRPAGSQRCNMGPCEQGDPYHLSVTSGAASSLSPQRSTVGTWHTEPWSPCGASCGKGTRRRRVICTDSRDIRRELNDTFCLQTRPAVVEECRMDPCPKWRVSRWTECSTSCGTGVRTREILCARGGFSVHFQQTMTRVNESLCQGQIKPKAKRPCEVYECAGANRFKWTVSKWSSCSASCDNGKQTRQVRCIYAENSTSVDYSHCRLSLGGQTKTPLSTKACKASKPCAFRWITGDWSRCSRTCGTGVRWRRVNCHKVDEMGATVWWPVESPYRCDTRHRPKERHLCSFGECGEHFVWQVDPWSECSVTCGGGVSKRSIYCLHQKGQQRLRHSFCKANLRPEASKSCNPEPCSRLNEVLSRSQL